MSAVRILRLDLDKVAGYIVGTVAKALAPRDARLTALEGRCMVLTAENAELRERVTKLESATAAAPEGAGQP